MAKDTDNRLVVPSAAGGEPARRALPDEADARQPGPQPPGHARHGARGGRARRRDHPRDEAGHRLPAPRLREVLRERHLDAGLPVHRPAQLRVVDHEQRRLRAWPSRSSAASRSRSGPSTCASITSELHRMCDHLTLVSRHGARARRHDRAHLRHGGPRPHLGPAHRALRRPPHLQLRARRRRLPRHARGLEREGAAHPRPRRARWSTRSTGCSPATASSSTAPGAPASSPAPTPSTSASPARACAPPACPTTCARPRPTWSTTGSTSTSRWARTATTSTAT